MRTNTRTGSLSTAAIVLVAIVLLVIGLAVAAVILNFSGGIVGNALGAIGGLGDVVGGIGSGLGDVADPYSPSEETDCSSYSEFTWVRLWTAGVQPDAVETRLGFCAGDVNPDSIEEDDFTVRYETSTVYYEGGGVEVGSPEFLSDSNEILVPVVGGGRAGIRDGNELTIAIAGDVESTDGTPISGECTVTIGEETTCDITGTQRLSCEDYGGSCTMDASCGSGETADSDFICSGGYGTCCMSSDGGSSGN